MSGKRIGLLGFAFKVDTNEMRESPAMRICRDLLEKGAVLQIVVPQVSESLIAKDLGQPASDDEGSWQQMPELRQAASSADALLLLTE